MTVPLKDGAFACPYCARQMRAVIGKYGAEIYNTCRHGFRLKHTANDSLVAEFGDGDLNAGPYGKA